MFGRLASARRNHASCSGCSLCLLVCPVWRRTHDPRMTPEGRAKALQHGATAKDIEASVESCTLCGACEPVCPEQIDLVGMTLDLRQRLREVTSAQPAPASIASRSMRPARPEARTVAFLPGAALQARPEALAKVAGLVRAQVGADAGIDIARALESGDPVPRERLEAFLAPLQDVGTLIVEDGLWLRHLALWLPKARALGLGEALSALSSVRAGLRKNDLYIIEPRSYHRDYERLVGHYDRLQAERGCVFNLDLQRIAIPAAGQTDWILKGRAVDRIVVERSEDGVAFLARGTHSVVHLSELADH